MKLVDAILKKTPPKLCDLDVIAAHAAGPTTLFVAIEAYSHEHETVATCLVKVALATNAVELVHEAAISIVDYAHADGWHGLLQRDAVVELTDNKITTTKLPGTLVAIARAGDRTLVCGSKSHGNYGDIDGFVASIANGKVAMLAESSASGDPGPVNAMAVDARGRISVGGNIRRGGVVYLVRGTAALAAGVDEIHAVHAKPDGTILVGARGSACILDETGTATPVAGMIGRGYGIVEFRGDEYWMSHDDSDQLFVWRRDGAKLKKWKKTKLHFVGYRHLHGLPAARMTATADLLVVTNKDRIHLYDGKKWSQRALQPNVAKLIKNLPAAMK